MGILQQSLGGMPDVYLLLPLNTVNCFDEVSQENARIAVRRIQLEPGCRERRGTHEIRQEGGLAVAGWGGKQD